MANVHIDIGMRHHPQPVPINMPQPRYLINVTLQRYEGVSELLIPC
jgi:hypothetical protein